jgi:hypothetical protein
MFRFTLVLVVVLVAGCRTTPPATNHHWSVQTPHLNLKMHSVSEPDARTDAVAESMCRALELMSQRLPRGLRGDRIDVYLLERSDFVTYVDAAYSGSTDRDNAAAFMDKKRNGQAPRLFVPLDPVGAHGYHASHCAVHELVHAWLGRAHMQGFGTVEEGVCNWLAMEAVSRSPDLIDRRNNSILLEAVLAITQEWEFKEPWSRLEFWRTPEGGVSNGFDELFVAWLYDATGRDDEVFRAELGVWLGMQDQDLDWMSLPFLALACPGCGDPACGSRPPLPDHRARLRDVSEGSVEAWMGQAGNGQVAPAVDLTTTACSLVRQADGRWMMNPRLSAIAVLLGEPGVWEPPHAQVQVQVQCSWAIHLLAPNAPPGAFKVAPLNSEKQTSLHLFLRDDAGLPRAGADDATGARLRIEVVDDEVHVQSDDELLVLKKGKMLDNAVSTFVIKLDTAHHDPALGPVFIEWVTPRSTPLQASSAVVP